MKIMVTSPESVLCHINILTSLFRMLSSIVIKFYGFLYDSLMILYLFSFLKGKWGWGNGSGGRERGECT